MKRFYSHSHLYTLSVFIFFCVFFIQIHPIIPHDLDDWNFMSEWRLAIPSLEYWNPTRIMPETLMPLFSNMGAILIYPVLGDYLMSMVVMHGIVVSIFATLYIYSFLRMIRKRFEINETGAIALATLFLMFHFLILRSSETGNQHLFYSHDLACYYNYTIPNLLCASLVMFMIGKDWMRNEIRLSPQIVGWGILVLYFAVFSHLYCSCILAIYLGSCLLIIIWENYKKKEKWGNLFKNYSWMFIVIGVWLIINLMEMFGARAQLQGERNEDITWGENLVNTLRTLYEMIWYINRLYMFVTIVLLAYSLFIWFHKKELRYLIVSLWLMFVVVVVYVVLLTSKVAPYYLLLSDVFFSIAFPILLLTMISVTYLYKHNKCFVYCLPIGLLMVFSGINTAEQTFRCVTSNNNLDESKVLSINKELIRQMIAGNESKSIDSVIIIVPDMNTKSNWPYVTYEDDGGYRAMCRTLYKHGVLKHQKPGKFVRGKNISSY